MVRIQNNFTNVVVCVVVFRVIQHILLAAGLQSLLHILLVLTQVQLLNFFNLATKILRNIELNIGD